MCSNIIWQNQEAGYYFWIANVLRLELGCLSSCPETSASSWAMWVVTPHAPDVSSEPEEGPRRTRPWLEDLRGKPRVEQYPQRCRCQTQMHWDDPKVGVRVPGAVTCGSGTPHCLGWGLRPAATFSICPPDVAVLTLHHTSRICTHPGELTQVWGFSASGRVNSRDTFLIKIKTQVRDRCVSSTVMWGYTHDTQIS